MFIVIYRNGTYRVVEDVKTVFKLTKNKNARIYSFDSEEYFVDRNGAKPQLVKFKEG